MERGAKIATAAGVFMVGLAVAMLFRHDGLRIGEVPPEGFDHLVLRGRMEPDGPIAPAVSPENAEAGFSTSNGSPVATVPKVADKSPRKTTTSAEGATSSSASPLQYASSWPLPKEPVAPMTVSQKSLRRHRISDGDTLSTLAQRYLGSVDRASEIFELNRESLPSPELLPIGTEIRLPPRESPRLPAQATSRLVPLPAQP